MASTDFTSGIGTSVSWNNSPVVYLKKSKFKASAVASLGSSDVYTMIDIPANTLVLMAWINVDVVSATGTVAYASITSANDYFTAAAITTVGIKLDTTPEVYKVFSAADTLAITVASAALAATCEITAYALCVDLNG
jgi:uridine phosphorylase